MFIAALILNEGKDVEMLPSVYYKSLITLSFHTDRLSGLQVRLQWNLMTDQVHYEDIVPFSSVWFNQSDSMTVEGSPHQSHETTRKLFYLLYLLFSSSRGLPCQVMLGHVR